MKLSIILPVYNVEEFIGFALESIYNQKLSKDEFEVIIVNDGSTDNFENEVKKYLSNHDNIILYHQENHGVSVARNTGIKIAKGDYLCFVDPDDTLVNGSLRELLTLVEENQSADIIIAQSFYNNKEICMFPDSYNGKRISSEEVIQYGYRRGCVWGCIYKRNSIIDNDIYFPEGVVLAEDTIFFSLAIMYAKELFFCKVPMYVLRYRASSASHAYSMKKMLTYKKNIDFIYDYKKSHAYLYDYQSIYLDYASYISISNGVHFYMHLTRKRYKELCDILQVNKVLPLAERCTPQSLWKVKLINKSFFLFYIMVLAQYFFILVKSKVLKNMLH